MDTTESRHLSEPAANRDDLAAAAARYERVRAALAGVLVGLEEVIELVLGAVFAGGHCLLEGVPGLAKTLLVKSVGEALGLRTARIQFTPDLMPSDITGGEVIVQDRETGERRFRFLRGPIFTHLLLADEINRTPPKTQAALIEAMEEGHVTSMGRCYRLEPPFHVIATQNPIEQEATYPLPAAQLDRFMYKVFVDYPSPEEEYRIVRRTTVAPPPAVPPVLGREEVLALQRAVRRHPLTEEAAALAVRLVRLTRPDNPEAPPCVREWVAWGAGPRAEQFLTLGARAWALLRGRPAATVADLRAVVKPVLRHRVILDYQAETDGVTPDRFLDDLLAQIPALGEEPAPKRRRWFRFLRPS